MRKGKVERAEIEVIDVNRELWDREDLLFRPHHWDRNFGMAFGSIESYCREKRALGLAVDPVRIKSGRRKSFPVHFRDHERGREITLMKLEGLHRIAVCEVLRHKFRLRSVNIGLYIMQDRSGEGSL